MSAANVYTNGAAAASNDVYWTTNDPRNTGVIGYEGNKPIFFRFVRSFPPANIRHQLNMTC